MKIFFLSLAMNWIPAFKMKTRWKIPISIVIFIENYYKEK